MKKIILTVLVVLISLSVFAQWDDESQNGVITTSDQVGIGTTSVSSLLEVSKFNPGANNSIVKIVTRGTQYGTSGTGLSIVAENNTGTGDSLGYQGLYGKGLLYIQGQQRWHDGSGWRWDSKAINVNNNFIVENRGYVGIGTDDPKHELSVNGTIWATEIKVSLSDGADWVFDDDYALPSLEEVEAFIENNKHLPEIPSAEEFRQHDLNVAEMDNKLLQKIEELTIYLIEQNKKLTSANEKIEELETRLSELENK